MKRICSGRMLVDTTPKKVLCTGGVVAMKRGDELRADEYILEKGATLDVVAVDEKAGTVTVASPIDPDRALVIAADAIALYNEATGIWQTVKAFFHKVGAFFKAIPSLFSKK